MLASGDSSFLQHVTDEPVADSSTEAEWESESHSDTDLASDIDIESSSELEPSVGNERLDETNGSLSCGSLSENDIGTDSELFSPPSVSICSSTTNDNSSKRARKRERDKTTRTGSSPSSHFATRWNNSPFDPNVAQTLSLSLSQIDLSQSTLSKSTLRWNHIPFEVLFFLFSCV